MSKAAAVLNWWEASQHLPPVSWEPHFHRGRKGMDLPCTKPHLQARLQRHTWEELSMYRFGSIDCVLHITSKKIKSWGKCLSLCPNGLRFHAFWTFLSHFLLFSTSASGWRVCFRASVITIITLSAWHISMVPITVIETLGPLHHSNFTPRLLLIFPNKI